MSVPAFRDLSVIVERNDVHAVLCDPNGVAESQVLALVRHAAQFGTRVFFTAQHTIRSTDLTLRAADLGLTGVLSCACTNDVTRLTHQMRENGGPVAMSLRLLAAICPALWHLPAALRSALVGFATSCCRTTTSIGEVARSASCSPRSVARWFSTAGLHEPRKTFAAVRLVHLWPGMWMPTLSMPDLAGHAGYDSERTMRAHCLRVMGRCPSHVRRMQTDGDMLRVLAGAVLRMPSAPVAASWSREIEEHGVLPHDVHTGASAC